MEEEAEAQADLGEVKNIDDVVSSGDETMSDGVASPGSSPASPVFRRPMASYVDPFLTEKVEMVRTINDSRSKEGLEAFIFDPKASEVANYFARSMMDHKFKGLWDLDGTNYKTRYWRHGVVDAVGENVEGADADGENLYEDISSTFIDREHKRIHRRMWSEPPDGPRKQHLISTAHTHIGIGFAISEQGLRYVEVYMNRYLEIDPISPLWPATLPLEISGRMLRADYGIYGCYINFENTPQPLTVAEIAEKEKKEPNAEDRVGEVWPWQIMVRENGSFSFFVNVDTQEGHFYANVMVRDNKKSIPYDYPTEGLVLPSPDLTLASTVVLEYDGRPLYVDPSKATAYITEVAFLDDPNEREPEGYTHQSTGFIMDDEGTPEPYRLSFTFDDIALPVTGIMLVTAETVESLSAPMDWSLIYGNVAPLLLKPSPDTDLPIVAVAVYRGALSEGAIPLDSIHVIYDGSPPPEDFHVLNLDMENLPEGLQGSGVYICYHSSLMDAYVDPHSVPKASETFNVVDEEDANVSGDETEGATAAEAMREKKRLLSIHLREKMEEKESLIKANEKLQKSLLTVMSHRQQVVENRDKGETLKRYSETLRQVNQARDALHKLQSAYDKSAVELQTRYDEKDATATEIANTFIEFKREIARAAENSRSGKPIPFKIVKGFEAADKQKDEEVEKVRLKNINLRTLLSKLENNLREKEQLAEGLHLIDFEQLKIENQTLNEKIEERNEELHKLRKKTVTTVQVLTHIKEKLQYVQSESIELKKDLNTVDSQLTIQRDHLAKHKKERDRVRTNNDKLKQLQGFATNENLVTDYEHRKETIHQLQGKVTELQNHHRFLTAQRESRLVGSTASLLKERRNMNNNK